MGKNSCDCMFGHVGGFLKDVEQCECVESINKICTIIGSTQQSINNKKKQHDSTTMIPIPWEISDAEVSQYKQTHYKMQFSGIKSYYCFSAKSDDVNGSEEGQIYNHGLSNNSSSKTISWKAKEVKRTKDPKQNPTSDPEKDKQSFRSLEASNNNLRKLLSELQSVDSSNNQ